jgi:hypothetical protein
VNDEKSKVVNLKKSYTDFLGFKLKAVPSGGKHKVRSHMSDKAYRKTHELLKSLTKDIQNPQNKQEAHKAINRFNAAIIGKHQYYRIATCVYEDFDQIAFSVNKMMKNRLKGRLKKVGKCRPGYIWDTYGKSGQFRYVDGYPVVPIAYIQTKNAMHMKRGTCNYTEEGRALIHKPLGVDLSILKALMLEDSQGCAVEYLDNRISLYAAQYGKCAVTGQHLTKDEIHCHHKTPRCYGGDDRYENLVIVHHDVHALIHAKTQEAIKKYMCLVNPTTAQLKKLNKLRLLARLPEIEIA